MKKELREILSYNPDHLSLYILTVPKRYPLYSQLPNEIEIEKEYLLVSDILKDEGFEHYEVSNFAKPGAISRHNFTYWKGESYGTYYENEWNAMSEDDQSEYWDSVSLTTHVQDDEYADVDDIFDDHSIDTEPGSIEIANNDADTNDTDPFGSDFDNNADMDDWA